jgi:hypothetical protein
LDYLESQFTPGYLGGEIDLKLVYSPKAVSVKGSKRRTGLARALSGDVAYWVLASIALVCSAIVPMAGISIWIRLFALAVLVALASTLGVALKRDADGLFYKIVAFSGPFIGASLICALFWGLYKLQHGVPVDKILVVAAIFLVVRGLRHLFILRPQIRLTLSVSAITLSAAASVAMSKHLLEALGSDYGIPYREASVPGWLPALAGAALMFYLLLGVGLCAAAWGWMEYMGIATAFRRANDMLWIIFAGLLVMGIIGSLLAAESSGQRAYSQWLNEFRQGRTPQITSDFMYRACVIPKSGVSQDARGRGKPYVLPSAHPVVLVQGESGAEWAWDPALLPDTSAVRSVRIDPQTYYSFRVSDGVEECR